MHSLYLFNIASQYNNWLSTRQTLLASNIANANTPGYKSVDLQPFEKALESAKLQMAATEVGHLKTDPTSAMTDTTAGRSASWEIYHSGNNVSLEQELMKTGEVSRAYTLNTNIMKSFHRMLAM
ncbi:MAG: flagellar basal body rod protein FlgB, partial [Alphaproteobacteria bacterium]